MRTLLLSISAGLLLTYAGCNSFAEKPSEQVGPPPEDTVAVRAVVLGPSEFVEYGDYFGRVKAAKEATLVAFSGGTVNRIAVKEGAYVKKDQSLANIDGNKAKTLYETAILNEKVAKQSYEQMKEHLADGNASQLSVDQAHLQYLNARAARIDAEKNREGALAIAPFNGIVVSRYIELHEELAPGRPTFKIAQMHKMKVDINISEGDIVGVEEGNKATVIFAALKGKSYQGRLVRLARGSSSATYAFEAQIEIDNPKREIKPGLTAHVKLALRIENNRMVVPTQAILTQGDASYVMLASGDTARRLPVEIGPSNSTSTVIVSEAQAGDRLIVENNHIVVNGGPIKVIQ